MEKIIAYSLWGNNPKYIEGAKKNIELAKMYFPDWKIHLYLSTNTIFDYISDNLQIIHRTEKYSQDGCFWRFESCDSDNIVIIRDLDDRLSDRHKFVVDEWLASDKDLHLIKDHPNHLYPVMAGLWGVRNGLLKDIKKYILMWNNKDYYTTDQDFLKSLLINKFFIDKSFIHDSYKKIFGHEKTIMKPRLNFEFLGDTFDEHDNRVEEYSEIIKNYEKNKN